MDDIFDINRKLIDVYGRTVDTNLPKFRIVWSSSQYEKRYGEFEVFSESGIYLRTDKGVEEVPKYLPEHPDMWVLEELKPTIGNPYLEMVTKFSYEPLWIFGAANSSRKPIWKAVQILLLARFHGDPNSAPKTPSEIVADERKKIEAEREEIRTILRNETPSLAFSLKHGNAVTVPGDTNSGKELLGNDIGSK